MADPRTSATSLLQIVETAIRERIAEYASGRRRSGNQISQEVAAMAALDDVVGLIKMRVWESLPSETSAPVDRNAIIEDWTPDRLIKIEVAGSTHIRTAQQWIDLARAALTNPAAQLPDSQGGPGIEGSGSCTASAGPAPVSATDGSRLREKEPLPPEVLASALQDKVETAAERTRPAVAARSASGRPVCWLKHGPYNEGEPMTVAWEDPGDDVCYSPLYYAAPSAQSAMVPLAEVQEVYDMVGHNIRTVEPLLRPREQPWDVTDHCRQERYNVWMLVHNALKKIVHRLDSRAPSDSGEKHDA